jgi:ubiquinone/menaquinone biosynthesis C-methylase UbiE
MDQSQLAPQFFPHSEPDLGRIHRTALTNISEILALLEEAREREVVFQSGLGRELDREQANIEAVHADYVLLATKNFDRRDRDRVALTFRLHDTLYLMSSRLILSEDDCDRIRIAIPTALYKVERRDRERRAGGGDDNTPTTAKLRWKSITVDAARILDYSHDGVALELPAEDSARLSSPIELTFNDGPEAGIIHSAFPKSSRPRNAQWNHVGMMVTAAAPGELISVERRSEVLDNTRHENAWRQIKLASGGARIAARRALKRFGVSARPAPAPNLVKFENARGETLVALQDSWRPQRGAPVIIIPPAWAKTKETLLPLARTVVATFRRADEPVTVLRLDGIRRRGESHRDPDCRAPGAECHNMTFSQGADDIRAALKFVSESPDLEPSTIILVTFSGAAIEARKALAEEETDRIGGWVSVVGAADLLSGLRVLSGGQDYIGGFERGVRFGFQRVLGIETDADLVCKDALQHQLAHLEDARRQMAKISVPITWLQGRHDAWIDPEKVREILSCGDSSRRRLIEVPTGHQLRTSKEALDVFQLIASEIGRFTTGKPLVPEAPDLADLELRRSAERERLPKPSVELDEFWRQYLLGRGEMPGMELLTSTAPYREMMRKQVSALALQPGDRIVDLGSGIGTFSLELADDPQLPDGIRVHEIDFLHTALSYSRSRMARQTAGPTVGYVQSNLEFDSPDARIPVRDGAYDAALMSLVVNYVQNPKRLLSDAHRVLRDGGRFVLSALRPDTDISKIYVEAANEVRRAKAGGEFEHLSFEWLDAALSSCLSEAARLVDLEEQGLFHFWESEELADFVRDAGFHNVKIEMSFGNPPQAILISAVAAS